MNLKTIDGNNINEYSEYVDGDVSENMARMYYRGLAGHNPDDDSLLSLLIWELKSISDDKDTESELHCIYAIDPSYIPSLMEGYHTEALKEDVRKTVFETTDPDEGKKSALEECGFTTRSAESRNISITVDECRALSIARKNAPPFVQSIVFLTDQEFYQGLMNILFKYDNPAPEDLAYLPKDWYEQMISCYTKTDGKVTGFLLIHPCPSGILVPILLFAVGADSRINLVEMMRFSIRRASELYPGNTTIRILRRNEPVRALSAKLFPDKKGEKAIVGKRTE